MAGTLADGSSLAEHNRKARIRQAQGQFDDKGAREAIERLRGRDMEETGLNGNRVIGSNAGKFNPPALPTPKKAAPAKSPAAQAMEDRQAIARNQEIARRAKLGQSTIGAEDAKPKAPEQRVATMPRAENHASPVKATPKVEPKPAPARDYSKENEDAGKARVAAAKSLVEGYRKEPEKAPIKRAR